MTGTEPHAPRGTAGRGPDWDRGHFLLSSFGGGKFGPRSARLHCDPKNGLAAGGADSAEITARCALCMTCVW